MTRRTMTRRTMTRRTMTRRTGPLAFLVVFGALVAAEPATSLTPHVLAQESGDTKKDGDAGADEEPAEKTAEEKELEAIGADFEDEDVDALIARIPEDVGDGKEGKVRLKLGKDDGTFKRTQATKILEGWLESRTITRVKVKSTKDLVGTFDLKWRRRTKETEVEATLVVRIAKVDDGGFVLELLEVQR